MRLIKVIPLKAQMSRSQSDRVSLLFIIWLLANFVVVFKTLSQTAVLNLEADPYGRVVDVIFTKRLHLLAPWDRFRFDVNVVAPLARDGGPIFGDVNGDGARDMLLTSFSGELVLFPGIPGQEFLFGNGLYVKHFSTNATPADDPYNHQFQAEWVLGDIGDLDSDGTNEIAIGGYLYKNIGSGHSPVIQRIYYFDNKLDQRASFGDLNGDGKADVFLSWPSTQVASIFWNTSTPGNLSFQKQTINTFPQGGSGDHTLGLADMNGDGLLDLVGEKGIYLNVGDTSSPAWSFTSPVNWNLTGGGPNHTTASPMPVVTDANGDGVPDVYFCRYSSQTHWEVLYFRNIGNTNSHQLQYVSPVLVAGTPLNIADRANPADSSSDDGYPTLADIDSNGYVDVCLGDNGGSYSHSTIIWQFPDVLAQSNATVFCYQDSYTFPYFPFVDYMFLGEPYLPTDTLSKPPNTVLAWPAVNSNGLSFGIVAENWMHKWDLYVSQQTGVWPFSLENPSTANRLMTVPSGTWAKGLGAALVDVNMDGLIDLVCGDQLGQLVYYRNLSNNISARFADAVLLTDSQGQAIQVGYKWSGKQSWPAKLDLNGDGVDDLLVASYDGEIYPVICTNLGTPSGYWVGPPISSEDQTPFNINHVVGGGTIVPRLAVGDVDNNGLKDVVVADAQGRTWLLKRENDTTNTFAAAPFSIQRTTATFLDVLSDRHIRLFFAIPLTHVNVDLSFHGILVEGAPISGAVPITHGTIPENGPVLAVSRTNSNLQISWSGVWSSFIAEKKSTLETNVWMTIGSTPIWRNGRKVITEPLTGKQQYYRLRK